MSKKTTQFLQNLQAATASGQTESANISLFESYTPAQALDVISSYFSYEGLQFHQKMLWQMYNLAVTNGRFEHLPHDMIIEATIEYEQINSLIAAMAALYTNLEIA